jgi:hypothetical protein
MEQQEYQVQSQSNRSGAQQPTVSIRDNRLDHFILQGCRELSRGGRQSDYPGYACPIEPFSSLKVLHHCPNLGFSHLSAYA